jgi:mannan endo-1,4-beta-mannosidase
VLRRSTRAAAGALAAVPVLLLAGLVAAQPAQAAVGIHVSGTQILEKNGSPLVLRGTSHAYVWYTGQNTSFANIKAKGANAVRVVLGGGRWGPTSTSEVANIVSLCKANKLICILEDHDTTGYGEDGAATTLSQAVSYWNSVKSAVVGQEDYIIVNIGNEPIGNNNPSQWTQATIDAVKAMRSNGFSNALMVDGPNWGQDNQGVMRTNAASVEAADTQKNTIFSVHMYGTYTSASTITSYVSAFASAGLPLVIGEFAFKDNYGDVDEATIMNQSIGWLGWSWSGNGSDVAYMDQVADFDPNSMSSWGSQLFAKIKATAKEATVYSGGGGGGGGGTTTTRGTSTTTTTRGTTTTTTARTTTTTGGSGGGGGACTASLSTNAWNTGFVTTVTVSASSSLSTWKVTLNLPSGATVTSSWNGTLSGSSGTVTVVPSASWNAPVGPGNSKSFGFQANGSATGLTATCSG